MELFVADQPRTDLQGAMKSWSLWVLSWMMTRVSLDTATKASISRRSVVSKPQQVAEGLARARRRAQRARRPDLLL